MKRNLSGGDDVKKKRKCENEKGCLTIGEYVKGKQRNRMAEGREKDKFAQYGRKEEKSKEKKD